MLKHFRFFKMQDYKVPSLSITTALRYLALCLMLFTFSAQANNAAFGNTNTTSGVFGSSQNDEFLPVEEAYVVTPRIEGDRILLEWDIASGYYLYQDKFKFSQGSEQALIQAEYPPGTRIFDEYFNKELTVYYDSVEVSLPLEGTSPYQLTVESQGCADAGLCYPPRTQYFTVAPSSERIAAADGAVETTPAIGSPPPQAKVEEAPFLPWVLLAAMLGGIILNLMPCVFPVLSLKALSFASNHLSRHKQHVHGWAYTFGVTGSFLLAAIIMLVAREAGENVGWGFQLQSPVFIAFMAYLFFAMSLSLIGMFQLGTRLMGVGQSLTSGHGLQASFFTGVLAALVASPCTAPLMATALGFAMTQPSYIALSVFAALGFGMALPFLLLSYSPKLAQRLPQPGPWMETLKQVLAFPLLLTCIWLLWVLGHQVSSDAVIVILAGATAITFGCWLWHKQPNSAAGRLVVRIVAVASIVCALVLAAQVERFRQADTGHWRPYSADTLADLRAEGRPVLINLTADWCITCLANDRVALNTEAVKSIAAELDVVMLKGDWTNVDPEITALLKQYGRSGVPLYLVYPADSRADAEILPQILTPRIVIQAMQRAADT